MCTDICCRDERKWCKMTWYVTFVLQILVTFVFWIGSDFNMLLAVGRFFEGVLVFMVIVFWIILKRTYYYLERTWLNYENKINLGTKFIAFLALFMFSILAINVSAKAGQMKMHAIYVDRGDAIVIESNGHFMLVDSGISQTSEKVLAYLKSFKHSG